MNKTFILLLILSVLILTAKSLETNDKLEIQDTFTKSTNCPPEQSKTYCSGSQPCCKVGNKYGCCPYSYGTCCGDGTCVPSGGRC